MNECRGTTPTPPSAGSGDPAPDLSRWMANEPAPGGGDMDRPNAAAMYDYYLGSCYNFAVDRDAATAAIAAAPRIVATAQANRDFVRRAVRYALDDGVDQFLDLGAGVPVRGGTHQVVRATLAGAPVVCIDNDPVIVAIAYEIVAADPACAVIHADIRDMAAILDAPYTRGRIDFARPVCVLLTAVLHYLPGDLTDIMAALRAHLCAGSLLVISHGAEPEPEYATQADAVREIYAHTTTPLTLRRPEQIAALFTGFDLIAAGHRGRSARPAALVAVNQWRPHDDVPADGNAVPEAPLGGLLVAVGRKPPHRTSTSRSPKPTNRMPTDVTTPTRTRPSRVRMLASPQQLIGPATYLAVPAGLVTYSTLFVDHGHRPDLA